MEIYRVHVSLREIRPLIWRRIELSSMTTLKQLHRILQVAMGREDDHLHEYIVNGIRYGAPNPPYDGPGEVIRESGAQLANLLPQEGAAILYVYDFGDYWQHDVRLETIFPAEPNIRHPLLVGGARGCPPEMREWAGPTFNAEVFSIDAANGKLQRQR